MESGHYVTRYRPVASARRAYRSIVFITVPHTGSFVKTISEISRTHREAVLCCLLPLARRPRNASVSKPGFREQVECYEQRERTCTVPRRRRFKPSSDNSGPTISSTPPPPPSSQILIPNDPQPSSGSRHSNPWIKDTPNPNLVRMHPPSAARTLCQKTPRFHFTDQSKGIELYIDARDERGMSFVEVLS